MSQFSLKGGWHPKGKDGGRESFRGDYKGINQVAGWVGKGKNTNAAADKKNDHMSRPLATLKDPSLFGPPPRNVNYHGGAALPNEITPQTGGLGAPMSHQEIESAKHAVQPGDEEEEEAAAASRPAPPPLPYRADRTGLQTDNLPPPPVRRDMVDNSRATPPPPPARSTPNLPPRLPSRQNSTPSAQTASPPPPAYGATTAGTNTVSAMNHSAMNRLGQAGVSVPALGIGRVNGATTGDGSQMSELQSRFQNMKATSNGDNASPISPAATSTQPPSWQQTQQSLRTAQDFQKDPSSVTLADAQSAAQTGQSAYMSGKAFREKHADKFDAAEKKASAFNKRYNVTGRLNKFLEEANDDHDQQQQQQQGGQALNGANNATPTTNGQAPTATTTTTNPSNTVAASIGRKPPPPPPPKKPGNLQAPPPVPIGTKPNLQ